MSLLNRITLLWAGVCIGGNMIATMAKFQVESLPLSTALEIGKATFRMVGLTEALLCVAFVLCFFGGSRSNHHFWGVIPVIFFGTQWIIVMPILNARTNLVIAGDSVPDSNIHIIYVALETMKVAYLLILGLRLRSHQIESNELA